jgi:DNA-binding CsgD family transcriptional regulator
MTERLTPRQKEIATLIAKGFPDKEIAALLNISPETVAFHLKRAFRKFNLRSRAELIRRCYPKG